jgi:hypothetical protein
MKTTYETKTNTKDGANNYLLVYTDPEDNKEKFDIRLINSSTDTQLQQMYYQSMLMYQNIIAKVITEEGKEEIKQEFRWYIPLTSFVSINNKNAPDYIRFNRVENTRKSFKGDLEKYIVINKEIENKISLRGLIKAKQIAKSWKKKVNPENYVQMETQNKLKF